MKTVRKLDYIYKKLLYQAKQRRNETIEITDSEYDRLYHDTIIEPIVDPVNPDEPIVDPSDENNEENEHDYSKDYLTFEALEDGTFSFNSDIEYKYNNDDWTSLIAGLSINVYIGDIIQIKNISNSPRISSGFIKNGKKSPKFNAYGNVSLSDNMLSKLFYNSNIINGENLILPSTLLWDGYCSEMFNDCTLLLTAPKLPATIMRQECYRWMFKNCTSLITAPELPATILNEFCYNGMFEGCTSLTTAPTLPATTLATGCYMGMFSGCTSLTTAPELSATTLAIDCCNSMFWGCTSLTSAPELTATILVNYCYSGMFVDCTSLNSITCLATNISARQCTADWTYCLVQNISSTGTFIKLQGVEFQIGPSGIPQGWMVQELDPDTGEIVNEYIAE